MGYSSSDSFCSARSSGWVVLGHLMCRLRTWTLGRFGHRWCRFRAFCLRTCQWTLRISCSRSRSELESVPSCGSEIWTVRVKGKRPWFWQRNLRSDQWKRWFRHLRSGSHLFLWLRLFIRWASQYSNQRWGLEFKQHLAEVRWISEPHQNTKSSDSLKAFQWTCSVGMFVLWVRLRPYCSWPFSE